MEWNKLLLGEESWGFLAEIGLRTLVMFIVIIFSLRVLGKRGVKQLSVFELGVIIGLGSAAGDPMFYKDVGLLPGILVFLLIVVLYRLTTILINKSRWIEQFLEGTPTCIIKDGLLITENFKKEPIAMDELFTQLRLHTVAHLGQVEQAVLENNGEVSVYCFADDDVRYGLVILPDHKSMPGKEVQQAGKYACTFCGQPQELLPLQTAQCPRCSKDNWRIASNKKRIP